ncbi:hypothetical protein GLOIN_2v1770740 [Rhizophagus clarus]|uniref:Harmonin-binding protein USHBP1 PDZ-binding domain-containing protein n=1 Tax=Rhizophagus clarus TaxID=94130 RepID=A0A8H3L3H3_9GLOM|nr:hypothetical protein GLOIN_2v1770740 [Rhizophagus clarus]
MVTDQNHSSDSIASEQEVIRYTKILAQAFGLDKQNAEVYSVLSSENRALKKQLEDYHSQHNTLEMRVKRLERNVKSLETELEDLDECVELDECVDSETVVDLIHEIVPSLIGKKGSRGAVHRGSSSYLYKPSKESDSVERIVIRKSEDIPHKQRRKARPRKVKRMVI